MVANLRQKHHFFKYAKALVLPIKIYHKYIKCNPYPMCYCESDEQLPLRAEALTPPSVKVHIIPLIKDIKNKKRNWNACKVLTEQCVSHYFSKHLKSIEVFFHDWVLRSVE